MSTQKYIQLLRPNGRAYNGGGVRTQLDEAQANVLDGMVSEVKKVRSETYPTDDNFNISDWEERYSITPDSAQTIEERTAAVKAKMDFPLGRINRLSLDFLQQQIEDSGFTGVTLEYNDDGDTEANRTYANSYELGEEFPTGVDTYNSIRLTGSITLQQHAQLIKLLVSIKPLEIIIYDDLDLYVSLLLDSTNALLLDSQYSILIPLI